MRFFFMVCFDTSCSNFPGQKCEEHTGLIINEKKLNICMQLEITNSEADYVKTSQWGII